MEVLHPIVVEHIGLAKYKDKEVQVKDKQVRLKQIKLKIHSLMNLVLVRHHQCKIVTFSHHRYKWMVVLR